MDILCPILVCNGLGERCYTVLMKSLPVENLILIRLQSGRYAPRHGGDFRRKTRSKKLKDHRENAKGRKREEPSPFVYNDLDDFALFRLRAFAINLQFSDRLTQDAGKKRVNSSKMV
jgi:hypothetical protein